MDDIKKGKWEKILKFHKLHKILNQPTSEQLIEEARNEQSPCEYIVKFLGKIGELKSLQTSS